MCACAGVCVQHGVCVMCNVCCNRMCKNRSNSSISCLCMGRMMHVFYIQMPQPKSMQQTPTDTCGKCLAYHMPQSLLLSPLLCVRLATSKWNCNCICNAKFSAFSLPLSPSLCSGELRLKSNCKCQQVNLTFFISWSWVGKDFIYFDNKNRIQLPWELIASSSYTQPKLNYRESLFPAFLPLSTNSSPRTH